MPTMTTTGPTLDAAEQAAGMAEAQFALQAGRAGPRDLAVLVRSQFGDTRLEEIADLPERVAAYCWGYAAAAAAEQVARDGGLLVDLSVARLAAEYLESFGGAKRPAFARKAGRRARR